MMFYIKKRLFFAILMVIASPLSSMDNQPTRPTKRAKITPLLLRLPTAADVIPAPQSSHEQEPARKRLRVDQNRPPQPVQAKSVNMVFEDPEILTHIFKQLPEPDAKRFACVSRACLTAAHLRPNRREELMADRLLKREYTPCLNVLINSLWRESTYIDGKDYNPVKLIKALHKKTSLLDEAVVDFDNDTYLPISAKDCIEVPSEIEKNLSAQELETLKPIIVVQLYTSHVTENHIAEQVAMIAKEFPNQLIALELKNDIENAVGITHTLINKIATYPIVALTCTHQQFPEGLVCLTLLKQLCGLSLEDCNLGDHSALDDAVCQALPLLTVLRIIRCGLSSVPASIGSLNHLRVLELEGNELTALPAELHKLNKLKVLSLRQPNALPTEAINCLPQMKGIEKLQLPSMGAASNPLPESSNVEQLENLELTETIEPLLQHPERFKKLKTLTLTINTSPLKTGEPHFTLPLSIVRLPALEALQLDIPDDSIIPYEIVLHCARNIPDCAEPLTKVADLWQLILSNADIVTRIFSSFDSDFRQSHSIEMRVFELLINPTIMWRNLKDHTLINGESILACDQLIRYLLTQYKAKTGTDETVAVIKKLTTVDNLNEMDATFISTLSQIADDACHNIPVCTACADTCSEQLQLSTSQNALAKFATATYAIINDTIKKGFAITREQFNTCLMQLSLCLRTDHTLQSCIRLLANLLFHYAVECNDMTNAAFMLNHGARINDVVSWDICDRPLHIAIRNRESTNDKQLRKRIDHFIYFLLENGANPYLTNMRRQNPFDLIAPDSSLHQKIMDWNAKVSDGTY